jgi:hypothetical protein
MPSTSYRRWRTVRRAALDDIETAHAGIGGTGRARRLATQQVNRAYVVILAAEFQGFCRELHNECVAAVLVPIPAVLQDVVRRQFLFNRSLDRGNANPSNLGSDFGRFGLKFWDSLERVDPRTRALRAELEQLNEWRNAIAHNNYDPTALGATIELRIGRVRQWRRVCGDLANLFDTVMATNIEFMTGVRPWP